MVIYCEVLISTEVSYEARFKRHELKERALKQKEAMIDKLEKFQDKQRALIARHRAGRKAHLIQTLLRAIRTVK